MKICSTNLELQLRFVLRKQEQSTIEAVLHWKIVQGLMLELYILLISQNHVT